MARLSLKAFSGVALLLLLIIPCSTSGQSPISSQYQPTAKEQSLYLEVVNALNSNDLYAADSIITQQLALGKDSLQWLFFKGMRYYADLIGADMSVKPFSLAELSSSFSLAIQMADARLENDPNDSLALFFGGGAYGYDGFSFIADGSLFKAVSSAKKGARYHEELIALHPDCYDAYLGPGLLNFAASATPWILKPILFILGISGSEETALRHLTTAYEKGTWVRVEAGTYLAQLYARKRQFVQSCDLFESLTRSYPMRIGLRAQALSELFADKRYHQIVSLSHDAMESFEGHRFHFTSQDTFWIPSMISSCSFAYLCSGDTASAIQVWQDFLHRSAYKTLPKWRAHWSLSDIYLQRSDSTLALQSLQAILDGDAPEKTKDKIRNRIDELRNPKR